MTELFIFNENKKVSVIPSGNEIAAWESRRVRDCQFSKPLLNV